MEAIFYINTWRVGEGKLQQLNSKFWMKSMLLIEFSQEIYKARVSTRSYLRENQVKKKKDKWTESYKIRIGDLADSRKLKDYGQLLNYSDLLSAILELPLVSNIFKKLS